ncbi:glucose 1-dehydrogenase [Paraburkholderia sp. Tr-20389]|uniref:SDR family NAD(P)-dependent oxidoreductase n=1 Tax=Paraburkholderia sp. Tr-20389 TaxID=2703903 RepID=UPI00197FD9C6|nr:glucose 1-dehydrogenase [Paraburkholderia sp. Tr-20389]MBN3756212.1 glucose 1-dehydrogenase [Paraburkholderia sp. Tr-20389]
MNRLAGKVAIVTGSSKGIGAAIAERLAADGAKVVVNYTRDATFADAVVARIAASGGEAIAVRADVAKDGEPRALVEATLEAFGKLDVLVNNAGIYDIDSLDTLTAESIDRHFSVNVRGLLLMTQAAARVLPAGGVVVNISSGVAKSPNPMAHAYCATKGAVDVLTRTLGMELGARRIRVVGIAPGFTETEGNRHLPRDLIQPFIAKTPLGRAGQPNDIAAAVSFAASDDAGWVTGSTIDVAGGLVF